MGGHASKSTVYYLGLSIEQQVQALEVWNKIRDNLSVHNQKIMERFFDTYPEYGKYFAVACKCEPVLVCEHPRVIAHWLFVLDVVGIVTAGLSKRQKTVDNKLTYIALVHKDMQLSLIDFERYTNVFITYLNQDVLYLSPTVESHWNTLLNTLFRIIYEKIEKMIMYETKNDVDGNELCLTPKLLGLDVPAYKKRWFGTCRGENHRAIITGGDPSKFNFDNEQFWMNRKEAWVQQIYLFQKQNSLDPQELSNDSTVTLSKLLIAEREKQLRRTSNTSSSAFSYETNKPIYNVNEATLGGKLPSNIETEESDVFHTALTLSLLQKTRSSALELEASAESAGANVKNSNQYPKEMPSSRYIPLSEQLSHTYSGSSGGINRSAGSNTSSKSKSLQWSNAIDYFSRLRRRSSPGSSVQTTRIHQDNEKYRDRVNSFQTFLSLKNSSDEGRKSYIKINSGSQHVFPTRGQNILTTNTATEEGATNLDSIPEQSLQIHSNPISNSTNNECDLMIYRNVQEDSRTTSEAFAPQNSGVNTEARRRRRIMKTMQKQYN